MSDRSTRSFLIIGAGLGGLTTALALLKAGFHVQVFEQAREFKQIGAGITLTPNATRVLYHLGIGAGLAQNACEPEAFVVRRADTGEITSWTPKADLAVSRYKSPYFQAHRSDLHRLLVDAVKREDPDCIQLGKTFVALIETSDSVVVSFEDGTEIEGDAVLGCDGIRSNVREAIFGGTEPNFTGQVAWRGLVPSAGLPVSITMPCAMVWSGKDQHVVQYRLRKGELINFVAISATDTWTEESWTARSTVPDVLEEFSEFHPDVLNMIEATSPDQCFKWGLFDRDPLRSWTCGRTTLMGDAAHPMLPFVAQGSAMAIEDAIAMSRAQSSSSTIQEGFLRYERVRKERTDAIVALSRAAKRFNQQLGELQEDRFQNLHPVYEYNAITAPI